MKKFKKNLKKLFAISVCTTLLTSLIFVNTNAAENNKSSKIAKSETIKSTTHLQNRSIKYRKGKRLSISGESSNSDIATYSTEANGTCGDNVTWELKDGILTISGNGTMDDFVIVKDGNTGQIIESESHPCPWENDKGKIKEVYIKDGVTKVGARAFSDCYSLTKVVIGNSVKSIGEYAFTNDDSLTDLTLGNSVETIEMDALYGISIKTLVLPASIKNLTNYSLLALWDLENIEISGSNLYQSKDGILYADGGKTLFLYPAKRKGEYTIPSNVTKIAEDAFAVTTKLDGHIGIDEEPFKGELPQVKQTGGVQKGKAQIYRKVYTGNMKHCMLAFLGKAKGYTYIRDTYDDGWIEDCVLGAFFEADAAIQAEYQFDETDHQEWIDFIVEAPKNRNLKDAFTRVAADPKTKLSRDNRFVGPALLCMKHHILPFYLAKGIAYGFLYRDESDIASIEITNYVKEHGIEKAIEVYCGLTENEWELKQLIMAQYKEAEKIR